MSPKSRGRPPSRRKNVRHAPAGTRRLTPEKELIHEALALMAPGMSLWHAELFGSYWVSRHGQSAQDAARRLVHEVRHRPDMAGAAALAAVRRVVPTDVQAELTAAIQLIGADLPSWAGQPVPEPSRAWLAQDPWGARQTWFVEYADPAYLLMVSVFKPSGGVLEVVSVVHHEALHHYDESQQAEDVPAPRREVDAAGALTAIRDGIWLARFNGQTDPPLASMDALALAEARSVGIVGPRTHHPMGDPLSDEQEALQDELADRFERETRHLTPDADVELLVSEFLLYGSRLPDGPLSWNPTDVVLFLLDHAPREVVLGGASAAALPAVLERWVSAALRARNVPDRWIEPVTAAVSAHAGDFEDFYGDARSYGPARHVALVMEEECCEVDDAVHTVRMERVRRRGRLPSTTVPPAAMLEVAVVLHGVRPRVWRRLLVPANVTLDRMHRILIGAMGWDGDHRHQWEGVTTAETTTRLWDVVREGDRLGYVYDLGDCWEHTVLVERLVDTHGDEQVPRLLDGSGACPPEDVGGVPGYLDMLDALADPSRATPGGRELASEYPTFDPTFFPLDAIDDWVRRS